jgi:hypothetical protein
MDETILGYVKAVSGVGTAIFDYELLAAINVAVSALSQIGAAVYDGLVVDAQTEWPDFLGNTDVENLTKQYVVVRTTAIFDPTASATIKETREVYSHELEFRISSAVDYDDQS